MERKTNYVDSASMAGVLAFLTEESIENCSDWTLQSAVETTTLLINNDSMQIAPGTGGFHPGDGLHSTLSVALAGIARPIQKSPGSEQLAALEVNEWLILPEARSAWQSVSADPSYCGDGWANWRDTSRARFWIEHASKLGCLYDTKHIPSIASVLASSGDSDEQRDIERELRSLWRRSQDIERVTEWSRSDVRTAEIQLVEDAFAVAALIRGHFHHFAAVMDDRQIFPHPIRRYLPGQERSQLAQGTDVEHAFIAWVLSGAASVPVKNVHGRIMHWADSVQKARAALRNGQLAFPPDDVGDAADSEAYQLAQRVGIAFPAERLESMATRLVREALSTTQRALALIPFASLVTDPLGDRLRAMVEEHQIRRAADRPLGSRPTVVKNFRLLDQRIPGRITGVGL